MENQGTIKPKNNLGVSLLTGCATSLAAFIFAFVSFYALIIWRLPSESGFAIVLVIGPVCGLITALIVAIAGGVAVFRTEQPRPLVSGLLGWAGISILMNIAIVGLGFFGQSLVHSIAATTTEAQTFSSIVIGVELVIILFANVLAIVLGWLVYRRQKTKMNQG